MPARSYASCVARRSGLKKVPRHRQPNKTACDLNETPSGNRGRFSLPMSLHSVDGQPGLVAGQLPAHDHAMQAFDVHAVEASRTPVERKDDLLDPPEFPHIRALGVDEDDTEKVASGHDGNCSFSPEGGC